GARHRWPPWPERSLGESLRIAGTFGNGRGTEIAAVERRRASARVLSANDTRSHAARAERSAAVRMTYERKRPAALRSPRILFRGSTPPGPLYEEKGIDEATHPGRKTGRITHGCLKIESEIVMAGLVPGIHVLRSHLKTWMPRP